jgi:hypothetical protein
MPGLRLCAFNTCGRTERIRTWATTSPTAWLAKTKCAKNNICRSGTPPFQKTRLTQSYTAYATPSS